MGNKSKVLTSFAELADAMGVKDSPEAVAEANDKKALDIRRAAREDVRLHAAKLTGLPLNVEDTIDLGQYGVDLFNGYIDKDGMKPNEAMIAARKMMEVRHRADQTGGKTRMGVRDTLYGARHGRNRVRLIS